MPFLSANSSAADHPATPHTHNNSAVPPLSAVAAPAHSARKPPSERPCDTTPQHPVPASPTTHSRAQSSPNPPDAGPPCRPASTRGDRLEPSPFSLRCPVPPPHSPRPDTHKASPTPPT